MDVPAPLAALPNWVLWSADKIPLHPNGRPAKSNDHTTWSTLADVLAVAGQLDNRIGFMFRAEDGLVGIDLDGAVSEGQVAPWALAIVEEFNCYSEFSPSGKGIHIICQGVLPDGRGRKTKLNQPATSDKQPAIEIYSTGRYFTFTGDAIGGEVAPAQDALDRLLAAHWPDVSQPSLPAKTQVALDERISRYMERIEPTVCGTASCHNRTMWAARCLITGFQLSAEHALAYLAAWATGGQHKWSDKELAHKINQAITTPCEKPSGWLLTELEPWPALNTDRIQLGRASEPEPIEAAVKDEPLNLPGDPGPLSHDFFQAPGLIQEMIDYHIATAPRPRPELSLAATLALLGTLTGRKIKSFTGMRTNLYIIGLADSGSGKEKPRANNVLALAAAGFPKQYLGSNKPASDSAMINALVGKPSMLIQIDEVSKFFLNIKEAGGQATHLKSIADTMLELYGSSENPCWSPKNFADSDKDATITHPHLCIYGTSTGEGFWRSVKSSDAADGFLARFMVIEAPAKHPRLVLKPERPIPQTVIDIIKDWDAFNPGNGTLDVEAITIPFDSAAIERLIRHSDDIEDRLANDPRAKRPIWSRTSALAQKLAMLFAASRGPHGLMVSLQDVQYAIRLANWSTRLLDCRIFTSVSENEHEAKKKRVLQIIREAREIAWNEMTRRTQWLQVGQRERNDIVNDLVEAGYVELVPQAGRAKPKLKALAG